MHESSRGESTSEEPAFNQKHVCNSWTTTLDGKEFKLCYSETNRAAGISTRILIQRVKGGSQPFLRDGPPIIRRKRLHTQASHIDLQE